MAEQAQPHHQAAVQHLAYLQQAQRQSLTVGDHNPWVVQAALEAYLQQDLERQRLKSLQDLVENPPL
jgi:hypothetical protein